MHFYYVCESRRLTRARYSYDPEKDVAAIVRPANRQVHLAPNQKARENQHALFNSRIHLHPRPPITPARAQLKT